jgi:hypothetical protein
LRRFLISAFLVLFSMSLIGCTNSLNLATPPQEGESDETAIRNVVDRFGAKLQMVSLLAPEDVLNESIREHYSDLASPALLRDWSANPTEAPGRLTSSPWPDRIEISALKEVADGEYEVQGSIVEVTSADNEESGFAAKRPVTITLKKIEGHWLIDKVTLGGYEEAGQVVYVNSEYGFTFSLPYSWSGYSIVNEKWEGYTLDSEANAEEPSHDGALIVIRHPDWAEETPRQDIPIMVFTLDEWESLQEGEFHIGAAPMNPSELGRSSEYVFALPARYNYSFPEGYEEVEDILEGKPLQIDETF